MSIRKKRHSHHMLGPRQYPHRRTPRQSFWLALAFFLLALPAGLAGQTEPNEQAAPDEQEVPAIDTTTVLEVEEVPANPMEEVSATELEEAIPSPPGEEPPPPSQAEDTELPPMPDLGVSNLLGILFKQLFWIAIFAVGLWLAIRWKRQMMTQSTDAEHRFKIIERHWINRHTQILVADFKGKEILLSVTQQGVTIITQGDSQPEEPESQET